MVGGSLSLLLSRLETKGNVGIALAKANEVAEAIRKSFEQARRNMVKVPIQNGTLPHEIIGRWGLEEFFCVRQLLAQV